MHQILIVEDDRINSLVLQRFLDSDYSFDVAYSGHQALEYLERKKYDLVLMDINLGDPSLDGVEVLRRYQKTAKNQNTPSIAVTAYAMMGDREKLLAHGFLEYLTKPVDREVLRQNMERILSNPPH
ncbi:MAG: two-component system response regulator [Spirochaetaceae bacterium]|nr:two-component system response regulator [Spirochaetaceae bacterium]|tara:strand:- start:194609 stop:194986 length:378 start_codon:yes stop_codon:yes gene_type:complete